MKFIADTPTVIYSTMSVLKNTIATDGLDSAAIVINLKDRYNNPITNKQVIIQSLRGTTVDTLTNNGILITNNDGACTAFISSLTAGAAQIKIIRPLELVDSFVTVTFTPTSVYDTNSTISANPTELTADSASISTIRITLKDTNNNLIPNIFVKLASNRGDSDFIMYANGRNDGDTTNAQGEVIAYLKSALAGTATIYVVEPTGLNKAIEIKFNYSAIDKFKVELFSVLTNENEIIKNTFIVGSDTAIIRVKALDRFDNIVENYNSSAQLSITGAESISPALINADSFVNGVYTGLVNIQINRILTNFSVIAANGAQYGVITGLNANDNEPPIISEARLIAQSSILNNVLSQSDNFVQLTAKIIDNSNSLTNSLIKANLSQLTGNDNDTRVSAASYDNNTNIALWNVNLKQLTDGQTLNYAIIASDAAGNTTQYTASVSVISAIVSGLTDTYLANNDLTINSDDANMSITIPKGSIKDYNGNIIFVVKKNNIDAYTRNLIETANDKHAANNSAEFSKIRDCYYEINVYNIVGNSLEYIGDNFLKPSKTATIKIKYPNTLNDVYAQNLTIMRLNEAQAEWSTNGIMDRNINTATNEVSVNVTRLSIYGLGFTSYNDLSSVIVYPNPWTPYTPTSDKNINDLEYGVKFSGLPNNCKISIFTISGELVRELNNGLNPSINWNLLNAKGKQIASGVYIYLIEGNGQKKSGKIAIVR